MRTKNLITLAPLLLGASFAIADGLTPEEKAAAEIKAGSSLELFNEQTGFGAGLEKTQELEDLVNRSIKRAKFGSAELEMREAIDRDKINDPSVRATGIPDEQLLEWRKKAMKLMGLEESAGNVLIFVSFSMPVELIRAYVEDAYRTGGRIIFKGGEKGQNPLEFMQSEKMRQIISPVGRYAPIQIDPRLYDAYQIEAVPAIVYSRTGSLDLCREQRPGTISIGDQEVNDPSCMPEDEDSYYKVYGAVSTLWALEQFVEAGADAQKMIDSLKDGGRFAQIDAEEDPHLQVYETEDSWGQSSEAEMQAILKELENTHGGKALMTPLGVGVEYTQEK